MSSFLYAGARMVAIYPYLGTPPTNSRPFAPTGRTFDNENKSRAWPVIMAGGFVPTAVLWFEGRMIKSDGVTPVAASYVYLGIGRHSLENEPQKYWLPGKPTRKHSTVVLSSNPDGTQYYMTWVTEKFMYFQTTNNGLFRPPGATVSVIHVDSNKPYKSGEPTIGPSSDKFRFTAKPATPTGSGSGPWTSRTYTFWRWVLTRYGDPNSSRTMYMTAEFERTVPSWSDGTPGLFTAMWRPISYQLNLGKSDYVDTVYAPGEGLYYPHNMEGPMPSFGVKLKTDYIDTMALTGWNKVARYYVTTVQDTIRYDTVQSTVPGVFDDNIMGVDIANETSRYLLSVTYTPIATFVHDYVTTKVSNTYLLKGASYTLTPTTRTYFGKNGYAGEYGISYEQPSDADYTVWCRKAGDLYGSPIPTFLGSDSGTFTDSQSGRGWAANYTLYAVKNAPEAEVPDDPDEPKQPPGGSGGGGSGGGGDIPTETSPLITLTIEAEGGGITSAQAKLKYGSTTPLQVSYPDAPSMTKNTILGRAYAITVSDIAPSIGKVSSIKVNGIETTNTSVVITQSNTIVVVKVKLPEMKTLVANVVSVPMVEQGHDDNTVTISPAPSLNDPNRWPTGTRITLTPNPVFGYANSLWVRDNTLGVHDEEAGGSQYVFDLDSDTVITAHFEKVEFDVLLTVKGSETLAAKFDWTLEESNASDDLPVDMDHEAFIGAQIGIFKIDGSKLQTAYDATYNDYVDMPIGGVDVSYDGGKTWLSLDNEFVDIFNAKPSPRSEGRVGKHIITGQPKKNVLHVRIRLVATVSVSVGMPPVKWSDGAGGWQSAASMIGSSDNNWGGGLGSASISGTDFYTQEARTITMIYRADTIVPGATVPPAVPLATLVTEEASPFPSYFNEYPYMNVEFGDTIQLSCLPATGYYFNAWLDGYFSHAWEDDSVSKNDEKHIIWPNEHYLNLLENADMLVDAGMKKAMLKMVKNVNRHWIIFTQDVEPIMMLNQEGDEYIFVTPRIEVHSSGLGNERTLYTPAPSVEYEQFTDEDGTNYRGEPAVGIDNILTFLDTDNTTMLNLGIADKDDVFAARASVVSYVGSGFANKGTEFTELTQIAFSTHQMFTLNEDTKLNRFNRHRAYLGVYKRYLQHDTNGDLVASAWQFVGRGVESANADLTNVIVLPLTAETVTSTIEYRVRWAGEDDIEPTVMYKLSLGYRTAADMGFGTVSAVIEDQPTGDINTMLYTSDEIPTDAVVVIKAIPLGGYVFVSWTDGNGTVLSTEAEHEVDYHVEGGVFLANFVKEIIPNLMTVFHTGIIENNDDHGQVTVYITRELGPMETVVITASGAQEFQLVGADSAYVVATATEGWEFGGWKDGWGIDVEDAANAYYPLAPNSEGDQPLYRLAWFRRDIYADYTKFVIGYRDLESRLGGHIQINIPTGIDWTELVLSSVASRYGVPPDTTYNFTAVANEGYAFEAWYDANNEPTSLPRVLTSEYIDNNGTYFAKFTEVIPPPDARYLSLALGEGNNGRGAIEVSVQPSEGSPTTVWVTSETTVSIPLVGGKLKIWARPNEYWEFENWRSAANSVYSNDDPLEILYEHLPTIGELSLWGWFLPMVGPEVPIPFKVGFVGHSSIPYAVINVMVNDILAGTVSGVEHITLLVHEGDVVSVDVITISGYEVTEYLNGSYTSVIPPVNVASALDQNQALYVVITHSLVSPGVPPIVPGTVLNNAGLWLFDAGEINKTYIWRSRRFEMPTPIEFNSVRLNRNAGQSGDVRFRLDAYSSPESNSTVYDVDININTERARRLPRVRKERYFEIEIASKSDVDSVYVATSMKELQT